MTRLPGEFELIARLCADLRVSRRVILGVGDDCAILAPSRAPQLVTIDSMVEGVHFKLKWGTPRVLGERALTVNLSDIAAMGGYPTACVINLAVRPGLSAEWMDDLYAGLRAAAGRAGVDIVGGNITRAAELSITVALIGEARSRPLRRDNARPGDEIYVTGTLGDAAAGWRILERKLRPVGPERSFLVARFLKPAARLAAGQALARMSPAPAAIDISDGLLQDLGHILERSGVGGRDRSRLDTAVAGLSRSIARQYRARAYWRRRLRAAVLHSIGAFGARSRPPIGRPMQADRADRPRPPGYFIDWARAIAPARRMGPTEDAG